LSPFPDGTPTDIRIYLLFLDRRYTVAYRVTTHLENLEKSGNSKVVREKSGKMEKVRGSEIRCVFQALNTPKLVFRPGLCPDPAGGANDAPSDSLVG